MDEALVLMAGANREIEISTVDGDPEFFHAPDISEGLVDTGVLPVIPEELMLVDLYHAGIRKFSHFHVLGRRVPGIRVLGIFAFELPEVIGEAGGLFAGNCLFDDDVTVFNPVFPVGFGENA